MSIIKKMTLFQKLLLLLLIVSFIPLLVSGYTLISINQKGLREKIKELHSTKAKNLAGEINLFFEKVNRNLISSVQNWELTVLGAEEKTKFLQLTLSQNIEDFRLISIFNLKGEELVPPMTLPTLEGIENPQIRNEFAITDEDKINFYKRVLILKKCTTGVYYMPGSHPVAYASPQRQGMFMLVGAAKCEGDTQDKQLVIPTEISLRQLQNLISDTSVGRKGYAFLVDHEGKVVCHPDFNRALAREDMSSLSIVKNLKREKHVFPMNYKDVQGEDMLGAGAPIENIGWGIVVQEPVSSAFKSVRDTQIVATSITIFSLIFAIVVGFLFVRGITNPISTFVDGAKTISKGDFDSRIPVSSQDEIGELAKAFNDMAEGLKQRDIELKNAYEQVIHSEKMAAFGQIGAGITHEIKNPLAGIIGQAMLALRKLKDDSPITNNIKLIKSETERCLDIVKNLLTFTRQEKAVFEPVDVKHVVETTIKLIAHQLAIRGIDMQQELNDVPGKVYGNANQLEQVLLNIIINAHDAMEDGGILIVKTLAQDDNKVLISIEDNGPGIPEDIRVKIFEPFFTTKAAGKGTGLGLSVSYGIIKEHKGSIELDSVIGKGTTFRITLPLKSEEEMRALEKERLENLKKEKDKEKEATVSK